MSVRSPKTPRRLVTALLAALTTVAIAACGGSSGPSGQSLVNDTFSSRATVQSGQLDASLSVTPSGKGASTGKAVSLHLSGPFQNGPAGKLPRFALSVTINASGIPIKAAATATGSQFFVGLGDNWFVAPQETYKQIEQGYAQAAKSSAGNSTTGLGALGVEPRRWLTNPSNAGTDTVAGVETYHVSADVNTKALLADLSKFSQSSGSLGAAVPGASSLNQSTISELGRAIHSAHLDIYTGKSDHILRRLIVTASVGSTPQTQTLLNGASEAKITLQMQLADLNKPQTITAPEHAKPLTQLMPTLQQLLGNLQGAGGSASPFGG